jgi:hypothetical protein
MTTFIVSNVSLYFCHLNARKKDSRLCHGAASGAETTLAPNKYSNKPHRAKPACFQTVAFSKLALSSFNALSNSVFPAKREPLLIQIHL